MTKATIRTPFILFCLLMLFLSMPAAASLEQALALYAQRDYTPEGLQKVQQALDAARADTTVKGKILVSRCLFFQGEATPWVASEQGGGAQGAAKLALYEQGSEAAKEVLTELGVFERLRQAGVDYRMATTPEAKQTIKQTYLDSLEPLKTQLSPDAVRDLAIAFYLRASNKASIGKYARGQVLPIRFEVTLALYSIMTLGQDSIEYYGAHRVLAAILFNLNANDKATPRQHYDIAYKRSTHAQHSSYGVSSNGYTNLLYAEFLFKFNDFYDVPAQKFQSRAAAIRLLDRYAALTDAQLATLNPDYIPENKKNREKAQAAKPCLAGLQNPNDNAQIEACFR